MHDEPQPGSGQGYAEPKWLYYTKQRFFKIYECRQDRSVYLPLPRLWRCHRWEMFESLNCRKIYTVLYYRLLVDWYIYHIWCIFFTYYIKLFPLYLIMLESGEEVRKKIQYHVGIPYLFVKFGYLTGNGCEQLYMYRKHVNIPQPSSG